LVQHQFTDVMANISMTLIALLLQVISIYIFWSTPYCEWRVFQKADHWQEVIATVFYWPNAHVLSANNHMKPESLKRPFYFVVVVVWWQHHVSEL